MDEEGRMQRPPRYKGEDTTPTSKRELMGWYAYGLAAEVFAVCGVGSFLPLTLEQLARERGFLRSDLNMPCVEVSPGSGANGAGSSPASTLLARAAAPPDDQCVIRLLGAEVNTASFAMYTFSLAVLVQALCLVSFSPFADHGNNRKPLLLTFGFVGAVASMLFIIISPPIYMIGSLLVVISVTCLGSSFVILNSFLPLLVANHPSAQGVQGANVPGASDIALESLASEPSRSASIDHDDDYAQWEDDHFMKETNRGRNGSTSATVSSEMQLSTQISSKGVGIGYGAAVFVQLLSILLLFILSKVSLPSYSATLPTRLILFLVGVWWFSFTMVSRRWLRDRPGPPLNSTMSSGGSRWRSWLKLVGFAWVSLWKTIKVAAKLRQVVIFLVAWFLLSDAIATVSGTAILFAKNELKMTTVSIGLMSIIATTSGLAGAFAWPIISRRLGLQSNHTIMACIALFEIIPLYGLMGYIPFIKNWGVIGLQQAWEIYPLAFIHGFVSGGLSSYCRSFFGLLIPPGSEAAFYSLYAITDKGSSVIGPAVVGMMVDATGQIRSGFGFLAVLIVLPLPLVWLVNVDLGRKDAVEMAALMKGPKPGDEDETIPSAQRTEEREGLLADDA